jgi:hypothetical protein
MAVSARAVAPEYARSAIADDLAAQVKEIANSTMVSRDRKERRITTTVRIAVVAATAYQEDRGEVVGTAIQMATAATRAAPSYAEVIARAIAFVPSVSRYAGAAGEVRAAAFAAARNRRKSPAGKLVRSAAAPRREEEPAAEAAPEASVAAPPAESAAPAEAPVAEAPVPAALAEQSQAAPQPAETAAPAEAANTMASDATGTGATSEDTSGEIKPSAHPGSISSPQPLIPLGDNGSVAVSADLGVRRDSNIFLGDANKVAATIYSATPGIEANYGQNTLAHMNADYRESFNRYSDHAAPGVSLASTDAAFGYDDGTLKIGLNGDYNQLYQNNIGILSITGTELIRSNVTDFGGTFESGLFSKFAAGVGATYNRVEYTNVPGLFGSKTVNVPFNLYYSITPKVDLSTGYTYSELIPDDNGLRSKGGYYNVGARGNFTARLTGGITAGYEVQRTPGVAKTGDLGLTGNLNYEITPKTSATLALTRDFATSAQGQVLKNGSYSLGVTSDMSNRWQLGVAATYRTLDYGPELYAFEQQLLATHRIDDYWEASFKLSFILTRWMSMNATYVLRNNRSTLPGVEFSDDVFGLDVLLHY